MKTIASSFVVASVLVSAASASVPQESPGISASEASRPIESVVVTAKRFHVEPQEFRDYEYTYILSSGDTVRFSRRVGRFYAAVNGQPKVEIFASGPEQFVTKDGAKLVFAENGDSLKIDRYEMLVLASGLPPPAIPQAPK